MLRIEEGTHPNGNGIHGKRRKCFNENAQLAWVVQKYMSNIRSREEWKLRKLLALFPALNHGGAVNFVSNPTATNTADRIDARRFSRQHNPMALGRKLDAAAAGASGPLCEPLSELIGIELLELV